MPINNKPFLKLPNVSNSNGLAKLHHVFALAAAVEEALQAIKIVEAAGYTVNQTPHGRVLGLQAPTSTDAGYLGGGGGFSNGDGGVNGDGLGGSGDGGPPGTPDYEDGEGNDASEDPTDILSNTVAQSSEVVELVYDNYNSTPTAGPPEESEPGSLNACRLASIIGEDFPPANWVFQPDASWPNTGVCNYKRQRKDVYQITDITVIENSFTDFDPGSGTVAHVNVPGFGLFKGTVEEQKSVRTTGIPPKWRTTYRLKRWVGPAPE